MNATINVIPEFSIPRVAMVVHVSFVEWIDT